MGLPETERFQRPFAICTKKPLIEVPTNIAQLTTVIEINAMISAYSIAVAPESSVRSVIRAERIRSIIPAIPKGMLALPEREPASGPLEGRCRNAIAARDDAAPGGSDRKSVV